MTNNRGIKFRGMLTKKRVWVYGIYDPYRYRIGSYLRELQTEPFWHYVDPKTVGQYTGLKDKNGKEIFEGDIVAGMAYSDKWIGVIVWIDKIASFGLRRGHDIAWENCSILKRAVQGMDDEFTAEIIGTIFENPELLEVTENETD